MCTISRNDILIQQTDMDEDIYPLPDVDSYSAKLLYLGIGTLDQPTRRELREYLKLDMLTVCSLLQNLEKTGEIEKIEDDSVVRYEIC